MTEWSYSKKGRCTSKLHLPFLHIGFKDGKQHREFLCLSFIPRCSKSGKNPHKLLRINEGDEGDGDQDADKSDIKDISGLEEKNDNRQQVECRHNDDLKKMTEGHLKGIADHVFCCVLKLCREGKHAG